MRVLLSKFCEYACKLDNGRHTMVGIFDDVRVPELPIDHPPFYLCIQVEFDSTETGRNVELEGIFMDEDGHELFRTAVSGPLPREQGPGPIKFFIQVPIGSIRLEREGIYRLDVLHNGQKVGEERMPVLVPQDAPA